MCALDNRGRPKTGNRCDRTNCPGSRLCPVGQFAFPRRSPDTGRIGFLGGGPVIAHRRGFAGLRHLPVEHVDRQNEGGKWKSIRPADRWCGSHLASWRTWSHPGTFRAGAAAPIPLAALNRQHLYHQPSSRRETAPGRSVRAWTWERRRPAGELKTNRRNSPARRRRSRKWRFGLEIQGENCSGDSLPGAGGRTKPDMSRRRANGRQPASGFIGFRQWHRIAAHLFWGSRIELATARIQLFISASPVPTIIFKSFFCRK